MGESLEPAELEADGLAETPNFEAFYLAQVDRTLAVVLALRGPRVAAEELVQDAFLRAYQRWEQVGGMDRPDLWVQRVALNLATSQLRRFGAEARALSREAGRRSVAVTEGFGDADDRFWRLVRRLPPRQARVVALHDAADLSVTDIGEVLGIAAGTVKAHLHQARTRLAHLIEEDDRG